jgi:hypothetical protein
MHEIEDAMLARIEARDEGRPRYRALRRVGGFEVRVTATLPQPSQVRQIRPVPLDKHGVHAIDAKDDYLLEMASAARREQNQC